MRVLSVSEVSSDLWPYLCLFWTCHMSNGQIRTRQNWMDSTHDMHDIDCRHYDCVGNQREEGASRANSIPPPIKSLRLSRTLISFAPCWTSCKTIWRSGAQNNAVKRRAWPLYCRPYHIEDSKQWAMSPTSEVWSQQVPRFKRLLFGKSGWWITIWPKSYLDFV